MSEELLFVGGPLDRKFMAVPNTNGERLDEVVVNVPQRTDFVAIQDDGTVEIAPLDRKLIRYRRMEVRRPQDDTVTWIFVAEGERPMPQDFALAFRHIPIKPEYGGPKITRCIVAEEFP